MIRWPVNEEGICAACQRGDEQGHSRCMGKGCSCLSCHRPRRSFMDWWRGVEPFGIGVEENPVTAVKKLVDASLAYDAEVKRQEQGRRIDFWKRDDLSYLEALVDMAPLLSARVDMPDPLTRWWKDAILNLIAVSKEAARHQERLLEDTDTPQPGHEVEHETGDGPDAIGMRRVIDAAVKYIHGGSDADSRQENYDAWRETYKDVFGDAL